MDRSTLKKQVRTERTEIILLDDEEIKRAIRYWLGLTEHNKWSSAEVKLNSNHIAITARIELQEVKIE